MALEDNFLNLDPYNFDTEEEFLEFHYGTQKQERNEDDKRSNETGHISSNGIEKTQH